VDDRLRIDWNYSKARYHRATIEVLANGHLRNLEELVSAIPSCEELPWHTLIPKAYEQEYSDLISDAVLDENIRPSSRHSTDTFAFDTVLLTGSTGFVGAFLLEELINNADAIVYCLIRARDGKEAAKRLFDNLNKYGITIEPERVIPLCGDLSKPKLGLSETTFDELSLTIDAIIHNGALTNLIQPYYALRQANVFGTKEIIKLACLNKVKPICYISTLSIFGEADSGINNSFCENEFPDVGPWLTMGYAQSKWVAEQLIRTAGERGCPVVIYRLGTVTGHSKTGAWNTEDFQFRLFASCQDP
jgi:thioester reductase-like protein